MDSVPKQFYLRAVAGGFKLPKGIPDRAFSDKGNSILPWLRSCLARGFKVNTVNQHGETLLLWVVNAYSNWDLPSVVGFLCDRRANVNKLDKITNRNALMILLSNKYQHRRKEHAGAVLRTAIKLAANITDVDQHLDSDGKNVLDNFVRSFHSKPRSLKNTSILFRYSPIEG